MEISLKRSYGYVLIFKAENVSVEEDIESRTYFKTEDGKTDFSIPPKRDISTAALDQISQVLDDMIYYREEKYDSSSLIENLCGKMPDNKINELLTKLQKDYFIEE